MRAHEFIVETTISTTSSNIATVPMPMGEIITRGNTNRPQAKYTETYRKRKFNANRRIKNSFGQ